MATVTHDEATGAAPAAARSSSRRWLKALLRNPAALLGLAIVTTVVLLAVFAPQVAPHSPVQSNLRYAFRPPSWVSGGVEGYLLGTDALGRDILSRIIYGSRISLIVGLVVVVIQGGFGTLMGLLSGYYGGKLDAFLMRIADVQLAIPFMILAIAIMAVLGPSLTNVILVLSVTGWVTFARVVRSEVLSVRQMDYVAAARALGCGTGRILFKHILPNVAASVIVIASLQLARMIISEAALSFLGLGVQPPTPSWGGMVADGRSFVATHWWIATFPALAVFVTVLGVNLLGDWVRDVLDPTLKDRPSRG